MRSLPVSRIKEANKLDICGTFFKNCYERYCNLIKQSNLKSDLKTKIYNDLYFEFLGFLNDVCGEVFYLEEHNLKFNSKHALEFLNYSIKSFEYFERRGFRNICMRNGMSSSDYMKISMYL